VKVLATYNFKGGVGKTSTCAALAYLAAEDGLHTLAWDLDAQGALSWILRAGRPKDAPAGAKELARGALDLTSAVCTSEHPGLDLVPAERSYRKLDALLAGAPPTRLAEVLDGFREAYDLVLLDAPPTLSHLAENVFAAADALLAPTIPTPLSLRTLAKLLAHLKRGERRTAVLPFFTQVDRRKALHREVSAYAAAEGLSFLSTEIPCSSAVERMGVLRRPLEAFAPSDRAALAYRELWAEVRARLASGELPGPTRGRVRAMLTDAHAPRA
jgi:cellulose biosynthesis protein BcsQ